MVSMVTGVTEELGETHTPAWGCQTIPERNNTKKKKKKSSPFHHVLTHLHLPWSWENIARASVWRCYPLAWWQEEQSRSLGKQKQLPFPFFSSERFDFLFFFYFFIFLPVTVVTVMVVFILLNWMVSLSNWPKTMISSGKRIAIY